VKTPPKGASWGKKSKLLPSKSGLNELGKTNRTIMDYSKQVPTNPSAPQMSPLLVNLPNRRP
jgi:hypothetical protein